MSPNPAKNANTTDNPTTAKDGQPPTKYQPRPEKTMAKPKVTYTIHETKNGDSVALAYPYTGTLRGAKAMASRHQGWGETTLTICLDGRKVSVRGHYGWYDLEDRAA
jgi:hypothetical protein